METTGKYVITYTISDVTSREQLVKFLTEEKYLSDEKDTSTFFAQDEKCERVTAIKSSIRNFCNPETFIFNKETDHIICYYPEWDGKIAKLYRVNII
ncbi:MAG: hypothetical protein LBN93_01900 [Candidatus Symbiothrix sp.]|jgi:hypothetical protein|nr:hypothetical protein [Candidatus Symbiothrix sp.]